MSTESSFKAYLSQVQIKNKSNSSGSSQDIKVILNDISVSDHDLTQLKNIQPDSRVNVRIKPSKEQLSLEDIEKKRQENREEEYNVL